MSFSVSGTFAVLVLGVLAAIGLIYPAVADGYSGVGDARGGNVDNLRNQKNTAIEITFVRIEQDLNEGVGTVEIDAWNNGSTALRVQRTDILIDNDYWYPRCCPDSAAENVSTKVCTDASGGCDGTRGVWEPGERLHVEVTSDEYLDLNTVRVKLVTEHDASDVSREDEVVSV